MDSGIGARVRAFREWRGLSLRVCADLAGMPRSTLSDIELGKYQLDRRSHIDALAHALRVSASELVGQPYAPADAERSAAQAGVDSIRGALMDAEVGIVTEPIQPLDVLVAAARTASANNMSADVITVLRLLPETITGLRSYASAGTETDQRAALRALVQATIAATSTMTCLGYPDLAWIAVRQARHAAIELDDPAYIGWADFFAIHATGPYSRKARWSERALAALEPHAGHDDVTAQVYGMLHLMAAFDAAVTGQASGDVDAHLAEARQLADRLGDRTDLDLYFGPTNLHIWHVSILVEQGEGGRVRELGRVDARKVASRHRLSNYHRDMFRALAQSGHDTEALPHLLEAERLFPEEIRNNPLAREAAGDMLRRAVRTADGSQLRSVTHRMGLT